MVKSNFSKMGIFPRERKFYYNFIWDPPKLEWSYPVDIPHNHISHFCQQLYYVVQNKLGSSSLFIPNFEKSETLCRFEWNVIHNRIYRLAVCFRVGKTSLESIDAYITLNDLINEKNVNALEIEEKTLSTLQAEITDILNTVYLTAFGSPELQDFYIVHHLTFPHPFAVFKEIIVNDDDYRILPTKMMLSEKNVRVSPVIIKCYAQTLGEAREVASEKFLFLCMLLSLGVGYAFKPANLNCWNTTKVESVSSCFADYRQLYPKRIDDPSKIEDDPDFSERLDTILHLVQTSEIHLKEFMPIISAYFSGIEALGMFPHLALIAFVAALSAMAKTEKEECQGEVTCSKCGRLKLNHEIIGEKKAIFNMLCRLFSFEAGSGEEILLRKVVNRVHSEQRSGYVHGARTLIRNRLRNQPPTAMPSESNFVRTEHFYQSDPHTINELTRRAILAWLAEKGGGKQINLVLFKIEQKVDRPILFQQIFHNTSKKHPITMTVRDPNKMGAG